MSSKEKSLRNGKSQKQGKFAENACGQGLGLAALFGAAIVIHRFRNRIKEKIFKRAEEKRAHKSEHSRFRREKEDWLKRAELMLSAHKAQLDKHGDRMDTIASQIQLDIAELRDQMERYSIQAEELNERLQYLEEDSSLRTSRQQDEISRRIDLERDNLQQQLSAAQLALKRIAAIRTPSPSAADSQALTTSNLVNLAESGKDHLDECDYDGSSVGDRSTGMVKRYVSKTEPDENWSGHSSPIV